ncbi:MAG: fumarylacetoacetate hydrolase family protein [bacterium]|nr:FAA hydrolase family protein [Gammaproteobacteria bacterium]
MRLITFTQLGTTRIGLIKGDDVIDLSQSAPQLPTEMKQLLESGDEAMRAAREAESTTAHFKLEEVRLESPVLRPPKILAIGLNYRAHAEEAGMEIPKTPFVFTKQATSINGPYDPVHWSEDSKALDYEGELGVVIGKTCRRVPRDKADSVIAGYCVINDVSVRDWQLRGNPSSFTMGKSWDTHCPMGPAIVTPDEVDPHNLLLKTTINGDLRQDTNTNDLIFDCYDLVSFMSTAFTLEAGDVIATGTPSGVGFFQKPPAPVKVGDIMRVEIEALGYIENEVIVEPVDVTKY